MLKTRQNHQNQFSGSIFSDLQTIYPSVSLIFQIILSAFLQNLVKLLIFNDFFTDWKGLFNFSGLPDQVGTLRSTINSKSLVTFLWVFWRPLVACWACTRNMELFPKINKTQRSSQNHAHIKLQYLFQVCSPVEMLLKTLPFTFVFEKQWKSIMLQGENDVTWWGYTFELEWKRKTVFRWDCTKKAIKTSRRKSSQLVKKIGRTAPQRALFQNLNLSFNHFVSPNSVHKDCQLGSEMWCHSPDNTSVDKEKFWFKHENKKHLLISIIHRYFRLVRLFSVIEKKNHFPTLHDLISIKFSTGFG